MMNRREQLIELIKILEERFTEGELRTLCFYLEIDYDDFKGTGKSEKAREIVEHFEHREQIDKLLKVGRKLRPDIPWKAIPGARSSIPGALLNLSLRPTEISLEICVDDIVDVDADIIALKFAQTFFGADYLVAARLGVADEIFSALQTIGSYRIFHSLGKIKSPQVLFVSVAPLYEFNYEEIRNFSSIILQILAENMPSVQHLAMTIHGVGYGLDETESLQSQLAGYLDAFDARLYPVALQKITIVERDSNRAQRLNAIMNTTIPGGRVLIPAETSSLLSYIKRPSQMSNVGQESATKPHILAIIPESEEMEDVYYYGIQAPVNEAGYLCERVKIRDIAQAEFLDHIMRRIETAAFVLADLTFPDPNFYLLLGYAWGKNRPLIIVLQESSDLQFYEGQHQSIVYNSIRDLEQALKTILCK